MNISTLTFKILTILVINMGLILVSTNIFAQSVGIGETDFTPSSNAILELRANNKGFLPPRMTQVEREAITGLGAADIGLTVYQTDGMAGSYVWTGSAWTVMNATPIGAIQGFMSIQDPLETGWAPLLASSTIDATKFPVFDALVGSVANSGTKSGTTITMPDWNTDSRFIRGSNTAGTDQDDDTVNPGFKYNDAYISYFNHDGSGGRFKYDLSRDYNGTSDQRYEIGGEYGSSPISITLSAKTRDLTSTDTETRPLNYSVIWHVYVGLPVN